MGTVAVTVHSASQMQQVYIGMPYVEEVKILFILNGYAKYLIE